LNNVSAVNISVILPVLLRAGVALVDDPEKKRHKAESRSPSVSAVNISQDMASLLFVVFGIT
jgi:hypothetical protein